MSLVTTVGASNANSYATVDDFKAYWASRLPVLSWIDDGPSDEEIEVALIAGARLLDALFTWTGGAVDDVQALCWPRSGMFTRNGFGISTTSIPQALKDAQCEFAGQLGAADRMSDDDAAKNNVESVKAGDVSVAFRGVDLSSIESVDLAIRRMGSEFSHLSAAVPTAVRQLLVPSWYEQPTIRRPLMFGMN